MRRRKQMLAVILAVAMTSSLLVGCGRAQDESLDKEAEKQQENEVFSESATQNNATEDNVAEEGSTRISDEIITLTMAGVDNNIGADWNNTISFAEYEKRLGIKFDATTYTSEQWSSKLTLMLAADEMPDILAMYSSKMSRSDLVKYASEGYFLDFSQYLDVMPNLKKIMEEYPEYAQAITMEDGSIYSFTTVNTRSDAALYQFVFMPQSWLDNVGLERPESLDELYTVLKAFKEQDANGNGDSNDEIPMGMAGKSNYIAELNILWAFGINSKDYSYHLKEGDDGIVSLWDISENYKAFLKYMNQLYEEGLINQDAYVIAPSELDSLNKEGKVGYSGGWGNRCAGEYIDNEPGWYMPVGFTSEDYNNEKSVVLDSRVGSAYCFVANAETKYPEEIAKFVDYLLTDEGAISCSNGYEGLTFDMKEIEGVGTIDHTGYWEDKYEQQDDYRKTVATNGSGFALKLTGKGTIYELMSSLEDEKLFSEDVWAVTAANSLREEAVRMDDLVVMDRFPALYYTDDEAKERSTLYTDITNYLNTAKAQFITGEMDIDTSWDAHIEKLNQMGLERLLEIEQAAYDRLK